MKITFYDDEIKYGIKYKVIKLDRNNFLLYPLSLVKGYDNGVEFKTENESIPFVSTKNDLKNRFVVDKVYSSSDLKYLYDFEGEDEFVVDFFFYDYESVIVLVNTDNDKGLAKLDLDYKMVTDQSCDAVYCMDRSYPSALLNEGAINELLTCKSREELEFMLNKYRTLVKSFQSDFRGKQVSRIYVSDGQVKYIESLKNIENSFEDEVVSQVNDEIIKKHFESDETDISYNGLRQYIKERVFGHDEEIDTFAQKIYMNYTALDDESIESILLVGPTGTGKTETVHAACKYLGLPCYEVNASNIVPQGIKGMSIEDVIIGLYENASRDIKKAEKGIIFLDEFDKLNDSDLDLKEPVKNILLTFTAGGIFPIDTEYYNFTFNSSRATKIYAGVFDRISDKIKSLGFNSVLEFNAVLSSDEELRKKIIDKKYFTLEELSRISTILAYNDLDRETKKQILTCSKLSEFIKKKNRYKRQFNIDLEASSDYIDAILDSLDKDALGMRSVNNYVKRTIDQVEKSILDGGISGGKKLVLTRDTVSNPRKFDVL